MDTVASVKSGAEGEMILRGFVTAVAWDDNDKVTEVSICTEDGEEYVVDDNESGPALVEYVSAEVEVEGFVYFDENDDRYVTVYDFTLLDEE